MKLTSTLLAVAIPLSLSTAALAGDAPVDGQPRYLTFLDSKLFDGRLSGELAGGPARLEVDIPGRVTLTNLPPRLDRWLTTVGENGQVDLQMTEPPLQSKALFVLLPMVFAMIRDASEARLFDPAKRYNATILYHRDAAGDSLIDKIVFTKKP